MGELRHKTAYTAILEHEQLDALRKLSAATKIPIQTLIREGVDMVLAKHARRRRRS